MNSFSFSFIELCFHNSHIITCHPLNQRYYLWVLHFRRPIYHHHLPNYDHHHSWIQKNTTSVFSVTSKSTESTSSQDRRKKNNENNLKTRKLMLLNQEKLNFFEETWRSIYYENKYSQIRGRVKR